MADQRFTEFTPEKRTKFLKALTETPNVSRACRLAKISRVTAYNHRKEDEAFAAAWDEALEEGVDGLVESAWRRAKKGDTALTIFLLKAHRPEMYRETVRTEHSGPDGGPIRVSKASDLSDDELARIAAGGRGGTSETP